MTAKLREELTVWRAGKERWGRTSLCKGPGVACSLAREPVSGRRLACVCLLSVWTEAHLSCLRSPVQPSQQDLEVPDTPVHRCVTCPFPTLLRTCRVRAVRSDGRARQRGGGRGRVAARPDGGRWRQMATEVGARAA